MNNILHSIFIIGGPKEKHLPSLVPVFDISSSTYTQPLHPSNFIPFDKEQFQTEPIVYGNRKEFDEKFIIDKETLEKEVMKCLQKDKTIDFCSFFSVFKHVSDNTPNSKLSVLKKDRICSVLNQDTIDSVLKQDSIGVKCWKVAIQKTVGYALRLLPEKSSTQIEESFKNVLQFFISNDLINGPGETFDGFDWFLATLFIACNANVDQVCQFGYELSQMKVAEYLWPMLKKNQKDRSIVMFCHELEEMVSKEMPLVASSFTLSGYTVSQVTRLIITHD